VFGIALSLEIGCSSMFQINIKTACQQQVQRFRVAFPVRPKQVGVFHASVGWGWRLFLSTKWWCNSYFKYGMMEKNPECDFRCDVALCKFFGIVWKI